MTARARGKRFVRSDYFFDWFALRKANEKFYEDLRQIELEFFACKKSKKGAR